MSQLKGKVAVMVAIPLKHEIPGCNKVIPGSLDKLSKLFKSLDCPGHPWTVGNYGKGFELQLMPTMYVATW